VAGSRHHREQFDSTNCGTASGARQGPRRRKLDRDGTCRGYRFITSPAVTKSEDRVPATVDAATRPEPVMALALPDQPSIAVLPFENLSDDPEQGYFVDGMVEEIITDGNGPAGDARD
jgi:hypothetical protein